MVEGSKLVKYAGRHRVWWNSARMVDYARVLGHSNQARVWQTHSLSAFQKLCPQASVVVDIGAHIGLNTLEYARVSRRVISIEPLYFNYLHLRANVEENEISEKVVCVWGACASWNGMVYLKGDPSRTGTTTVDTSREPTIEEGIQTPNAYVGDYLVNQYSSQLPISFIKIDVRGMELLVAEGLRETIKNHRPPIQIDSRDRLSIVYGSSTRKLVAYFKEKHGYSPYYYNGDAVTKFDDPDSRLPSDIFFIPTEDTKLRQLLKQQ